MRSSLALKAVATLTRATPRVRGVGRVCQSIATGVSRRWTGTAVVMRVNGLLMSLDPREGIDRSLIFTPQWSERHEWHACRDLLRAGDVAIDVGANIGSYTLLMATLVGPHGRVVAVEAAPATAEVLRENVALNGLENVTVLACGISETRETRFALWNQRSGNRGASTFLERPDDGREYSPSYVPCVPLSDIVVTSVRMLKLDIEGLEASVMRAFLAHSLERPDFVLTEQWSDPSDPSGVVRMLLDAGYRLHDRWENNYLLMWTSSPAATDTDAASDTIDS